MEPRKGEDRVSFLFQAQHQHQESAAVCTWSYKGMRVVCFPGDAVPSQSLSGQVFCCGRSLTVQA